MSLNLFAAASAATTALPGTTAAGEETTTMSGFMSFFSQYGMIIFIVVIFAVMYFLMIRPQKKQQRIEAEMRNNLSVGDEIITIGGIMGRVVTVKEDSLIIETGSDRNKMRILRSAVSKVVKDNEPAK